MAKFKSPSRSLALTIVSTLLSLAAVIFAVIVFVAGVKPGVLDDLALFKIDASDLMVPSRLSSSSFLKDLESVSGGDLTGIGQTSASLGIADNYAIHVLGVCSESGDETTCTSPEVGYWFNAKKGLKLDRSGLSSKLSGDFNDALNDYKKAAYFMSIGYIIAVVFGALSPIISTFGGRVRTLGSLAAALSWISTILLLADAVTSLIVSRDMVSALNKNLGKLGLDASLGKLAYIPFGAFALSFVASCLFGINATRAGSAAYGSRVHAVGGDAGLSDIDREVKSAKSAGGLFQRATTWSRHRYVQVERQPEIKVSQTAGYEQAAIMDPSDEVQDQTTIDYKNPVAERDIAMVPLSHSGDRLDLVYEPYASQVRRSSSPGQSDRALSPSLSPRYNDTPP